MDNIKSSNGIKPHGKGIQITFTWNGERHRPTLRIEPTKNNLKFAENLKGEIERAIALGTYTREKYAEHFPTSKVAREIIVEQKKAEEKEEKTKFSVLAKDWLKTCSELSNGTLSHYERMLNFWIGKIGDQYIADIKPSELKVLANSQGWGSKWRNDMLIPLRGVFELAYEDDLIETIPTDRLKNSKVQKSPPDPLNLEEVNTLLTYMKTHYDPQISNYFEFAFFTGMRPSEIISLRWSDIDWHHGLARVQRARTFNQEHETKTYTVRDVELNTRAVQALERQKQYTLMKDSYIFEDPVTNKPFKEDRPLRRVYWHPACKGAKIRGRKCYQTRHTFATLNLMAGANPMWVSRQLGHTNMTMLLNVYGKWIDGADKSSERRKLDVMSATAPVPNATNMPQDVVIQK